MLVFSTRVYTN